MEIPKDFFLFQWLKGASFYKKTLCSCWLFLGLLSPGLALGGELRKLHVELSYSGSAVAFKLYKDGIPVCVSNDPAATQMDCEVEIDPAPMTFVLTAVDAAGSESPHSEPYVLFPPGYNQAPRAVITATPAQAGSSRIGFDGTASSDADGVISSYAWDFGDGQTALGNASVHEFMTPGEYLVRLTVTDDQGASGEDRMIMAVVNAPAINSPPQATGKVLSARENGMASGILPATDRDHNALAYSIVTRPKHGRVTLVNAGSGLFTYKPARNYHGTDSFTFRASDGKLNSAVATVSIRIAQAKASRAMRRVVAKVRRGGYVSIPVPANDTGTGKNPLRLVSVTAPRYGKTSIMKGAIRYEANATHVGAVTFQYTLSTGKGEKAIGAVTVTVR